MAGRSTARRVDEDPGWVQRRFREVFGRLDDLDGNKLDSPPGQQVTIDQVLTDPASLVGFLNTDQTTALADDAAVILNLTYVPIDGSTHVRQNGVDLLREEWTRVGNVVTIDPSTTLVIRTDDVFDAAYAYDATAVAEVTTDSSYDEAVLAEPTLLAYWRHAETSGLVMEDSSGNNRHGTYTSDVVLAEPAILDDDPDTAAGFHGATARGVVSYASWMNVATFTIETWIEMDGPSAGTQYIVDRDTNARSWMMLCDTGGNFHFEQIQGGSASSIGVTALDDTARHMVATTYDGSNLKLYVDGALIQTTACTGNMSTAADLAVGAGYAGDATWWAPYYLQSKLSKTAYYSGAQSAASILNRYEIGTGS